MTFKGWRGSSIISETLVPSLVITQKKTKITKEEITKHKTRPNNNKPLSPISTHLQGSGNGGKQERESVWKK